MVRVFLCGECALSFCVYFLVRFWVGEMGTYPLPRFLCWECALRFCGNFSVHFWIGEWELIRCRGFSAGSARCVFAAIFRCIFGSGSGNLSAAEVSLRGSRAKLLRAFSGPFLGGVKRGTRRGCGSVAGEPGWAFLITS